MVATIHQLIGKINPWLYAEEGDKLVKKYGSPENIPAEEIKPKPISEHSLVYDSSAETLEPIYFFILDLMNDFGLEPEKYTDTFTSSPGSGHFSELGTKATAMQQQGTKILGDINTVMRSILNIIYDLREFKIRLQSYDDLKSGDKNRAQAAVLSLKQIWLDKVDINKGNSSVKAMALGQAGFQTLIDAFLVAKNLEDADKIDLNDRVKRIVKARIVEFGDWLENSGKELRKRYEIEKTYLKSQVNSMKLYARWAKPYLRAAAQLEMRQEGREREPALVKVFNTLLLELTLLGKSKLKIQDLALEGKLPSEFKRLQQKRDYYNCVLVDFKFRGIPQKAGQHYMFGGRSEITFTAYALNSDEIEKLNEEVEKSEIGDVFGLIEGITTESLEQLKNDIEYFIGEDSEHNHEHEHSHDQSNPFMALIGGYNKKQEVKKDEGKSESKKIVKVMPDTWIEKTHLRTLAASAAEDMAFKLFDVYKSAHGMPSYT